MQIFEVLWRWLPSAIAPFAREDVLVPASCVVEHDKIAELLLLIIMHVVIAILDQLVGLV